MYIDDLYSYLSTGATTAKPGHVGGKPHGFYRVRTQQSVDLVQGNSPESSPRANAQNAAERPAEEEHLDKPVMAPAADRRRSSLRPLDKEQNPEVMCVREYDRGRELRTEAIQGAEVLAMLSSLVGENQAMNKRKVCYHALRSDEAYKHTAHLLDNALSDVPPTGSVPMSSCIHSCQHLALFLVLSSHESIVSCACRFFTARPRRSGKSLTLSIALMS